MSSKTLELDVDSKLKSQVENICSELGITLSTAIEIFFKAVIRNNGMPFAISLPRQSTTLDIDFLSNVADRLGKNIAEMQDILANELPKESADSFDSASIAGRLKIRKPGDPNILNLIEETSTLLNFICDELNRPRLLFILDEDLEKSLAIVNSVKALCSLKQC